MDKRHDDWDRCAPAVGGALAFLVPLAVLTKNGAHVIDIARLFSGASR